MTATNPLDRTAIDTVLIKLNLGCQYMEINHPSKADVKKASEAAKDAADILKACLVLLDHDIYVVQEAPPAPGVPLFKDSGEPSRGVEVPAPGPTPEPAKVLPTLGIIDVEVVRKFKVGDKVKEVLCQEDLDAGETPRTGVIDEDDGSDEDNAPYSLNVEKGYGGWFNADELEMVEAGPELTADQKTLSEPFPKGTKAEQKVVFGQRLATLEDIFCQRRDPGFPAQGVPTPPQRLGRRLEGRRQGDLAEAAGRHRRGEHPQQRLHRLGA